MAKTMPWGKYKGEPLDAVPLGYIAWLFEQWIENPGGTCTSRRGTSRTGRCQAP